MRSRRWLSIVLSPLTLGLLPQCSDGGAPPGVPPPVTGESDAEATSDGPLEGPVADEGAPETMSIPDAGADSTEAPPDARPGADGPSPLAEPSIPASKSSLRLSFDATLGGDINGMNMSVSITHNVGTLNVDGNRYPVVLYEQIPWPSFTLTLYQALAVLPDRWALIWFYCSGNKLINIQYEETRGAPLAVHDALGSCAATQTPITVPVEALASVPSLGPLVRGFQVRGTSLSYDGTARGTMTFGGRSWTLHPFNLVDCSANCGSPGWYELHSLYWDPAGGGQGNPVCFGIFYLEKAAPNAVRLQYSICLPEAMLPPGQVFPSRWRLAP
jgi:hypothetical protein